MVRVCTADGLGMAKHIRMGKQELNFSEFGAYSKRMQQSKLKAIANQVEDGTMPLGTYTTLHHHAQLTATQKRLIINWAKSTKDSISAKSKLKMLRKW